MASYTLAEFSNGNIPAAFREENRLLSESDPIASAYSDKMQGIYKRLLEGLDQPRRSGRQLYPGLGKKTADHPVRFLLSADKEPNAFIIPSAEPTLVVFTAGLIALCEKDAELAGVLGHELGHQEFEERLGLRDVGKGEEGASDFRAAYILRMAHYPQTATREILEKLPGEEMRGLAAIGDVHPMKHNRISTLSAAEVGFDNAMGEQDNPDSSPLNRQFKATVAKASFETRVDRLFRDADYDRASPERKIQVIKDVMGEVSKFRPVLSSDNETVDEKIAGLKRKDAPGAFDDLVDYIAADYTLFNNHYTALVEAEIGKKPAHDERYQPVGRLRGVQEEITRFTSAKSDQEIRQSAQRLEALMQPYANADAVSSYVAFKGFEWPANLEKIRSPQSPPWEKHVQQALAGNAEVKNSLKRLNILGLDPRLAAERSAVSSMRQTALDTRRHYRGTEGHKDSAGNELQGTYTVDIDEQGRITGLSPEKMRSWSDIKTEERKEQDALEKQAHKQREVSERAVLAAMTDADWELLRTDFDRFVGKYREQLNPFTMQMVDGEQVIVRLSDGTYPFAEAFIKKVNDDIETLGPKVKDFLPRNFTQRKFLNAAVPVSHPFVAFALDDSHNLFSVQDKLQIAQFARRYNASEKDIQPDARWLLPNEKLFDGLPKNSIKELREWIAEVSPHAAIAKDLLQAVVQFETFRTADKAKKIGSIDDVLFLRDVASMQTRPDMLVLRKALGNETTRLISDFAKSSVSLSDDPLELADEFAALSAKKGQRDPSIFEREPALRGIYQNAVQEAFGKITDPNQKAEVLEKLLFSRELGASESAEGFDKIADMNQYRYSGGLSDPEFKEWAIGQYADILTEQMGKDNGSPAYTSRFKGRINHLIGNTTSGNAVAVMQRLGKKRCGNQLLLHEDSANYLKESITSIGMRELVSHNFAVAVGEGVFDLMKRDDQSRAASIDFLTKPFDPKASKQFAARIQLIFPPELSEEARTEKLASLHRNFWSLPFEARSIAMQQILFPDNVSHGQNPDEINAIIKTQALDKVFPLTNGRETVLARKVVESYLEATDNVVENSIIGAAMLVANPPNGNTQGQKLSVGKGLRLVLGAIAPAGDKVAQAIESHPNTPADMKAEFKDSKTAAQDPMRHEVLEWVKVSNDALEHDGRKNECIVEVGRVLGAGSYGITVEGTLENGSTIARTILYPYVRERADKQFGTLEKAADILVKKDKRFEPVKDMIRQASRMSGIETDMDIAAKQAETADKLYSDLKVTVDAEEFSFSAAKYLGHGHDHKDFEIIPGAHFNDVADEAKSEAAQARVVKLAKAQMAAELSHILSGRPFDHDRHGGQQRIVENNIGQFDFGAMTVTETSDREKQMIGHVLGGMIWLTEVKGRSMDDALRTEMARVPANEEEKDFLASVERALLALGNFNSHLGGMEFGDILGAIYCNNQLDPVIEQGIREALPSHSDRVFAELKKKGEASGITIAMPEREFDKSTDTTPLGEAPKKGWLEKAPVKDNHVQAGIGVATAAAGAGALYHASRQSNSKENVAGNEKAAKTPVFKRVYSVCAAVLTALGGAIAIDGLAFQGRGTKATTSFVRNTLAGDYNHKLSFNGSNNGNTIMMGAAVFGLGATLLLAKKQYDKKQTAVAGIAQRDEQRAGTWAAREQNRADSRRNTPAQPSRA